MTLQVPFCSINTFYTYSHIHWLAVFWCFLVIYFSSSPVPSAHPKFSRWWHNQGLAVPFQKPWVGTYMIESPSIKKKEKTPCIILCGGNFFGYKEVVLPGISLISPPRPHTANDSHLSLPSLLASSLPLSTSPLSIRSSGSAST